jgi:hypothetical protein
MAKNGQVSKYLPTFVETQIDLNTAKHHSAIEAACPDGLHGLRPPCTPN